MNVLVTRDVLEDQWGDLTPEEQQLIESLDEIFVTRHEIVSEVLPTQAEHPRERWWWFLHEGPQVKHEAERLVEARST